MHSDSIAMILFPAWAMQAGFALLSLAFVLAGIRLIKGPSMIDRVLALDLMAGLAIGYSVLLALYHRDSVYLNLALCLAFITFIGTVALARYLERVPPHD